MRLWRRPQRFVALAKDRGRAWSSALLVASLTLALASFGVIEPNKPAEAAAVQCPADSANITYTYSSPNCTATITFSGAMRTFTVPAGVTEITFTVDAGAGGQGYTGAAAQGLGGTGGRVTGKLAVTGGTVLNLYVGGKGQTASSGVNGAGGWNGGGIGGYWSSCSLFAGGGGGASDIRIGGTDLSNRVVAAGGGGGAGTSTCSYTNDVGGSGGTASSGLGQNGQYNGSTAGNSGAGLGASQSAGGGIPVNGIAAHQGTLGQGGHGYVGYTPSYPGGGGGGGYYGGSGAWLGAGGGGSSWVDTARVTTTAYSSPNTGNGQIQLTYLAGATISSFTATNVVNATAGNNGYISGKSINYSLSFSMPVTGFGPEDITISGTSGGSGTWTKSALSGSGAGPYTFTLSNASAVEGTVIATVNAAGTLDNNNNNVGIGTQAVTTTIDTVSPTITNISWTAGSNVQTANTLSVTFSEVMTGVTANSLTLSGVSGGSGTWTKTLASGSGAGPYVFNIENVSAIDGRLDAQIAASALVDYANNANVGSALATRNFTLQPGLLTGNLNTFGAGTITLAPDATLIDRGSSSLVGLKVSVTGSAQAGDTLSFTNNNATNFGTIQSATSSSQVLTLTYGGAQPTLAQWQAAIRAVKFTTSTAGTARTVEFHLKPTAGYNYDNMHFYQWVSGSVSTGDTAMSNAAGYTYKGMQGYLTTVTSSAENAFVYALSGNLGTWLGATQVTASSNNWKWAVGPENGTQFSTGATSANSMYVNWWSGEPNNSANYVFMTTQATWDDLVSSQSGAYYNSGNVVEYGSQTNGDPATSILKVTATMPVSATAPTATMGASSASGSSNTNAFTITASSVGIDC